jgi:hypothetical protein
METAKEKKKVQNSAHIGTTLTTGVASDPGANNMSTLSDDGRFTFNVADVFD